MGVEKVTLLTGPPGSGKGTQARLFAAAYGWETFSIGSLLRETASEAQRELMDSGKLLPTEDVVKLVIDKVRESERPVLVDGFPRRLDQAESFDNAVVAAGGMQPKTLLLDISQEESWRRISMRGRADDDRKAWEQRWIDYRTETLPAIDYYRPRQRLLVVNGEGEVQEVAERIKQVLIAR